MANNLTFSTKVSGKGSTEHEIRGKKLSELVSSQDFVGTLALMVTGKKAPTGHVRMLNALLTASIDHGIYPASGFVPRVVTSSGNDALTAMASTLLALGPYHGGAITPAMEAMLTIGKEDDIEQACSDLVQRYRAEKKRIMGFGHPHYTDQDPRAQQLLTLARDNGIPQKYIDVARTLEQSLENELGRRLVLNIDGAIAAVLLCMDWPPTAGNALFGLARAAGSIAHIVEEQQESPVRRLDSDQVEYSP